MEKYFVCSDDAPVCIRFSLEDAKEQGSEFIDVFDTTGESIAYYKRCRDGEYKRNE